MNKQNTVNEATTALEDLNKELERTELYLSIAEESLQASFGIVQQFMVERRNHFASRRNELLAKREFAVAFLQVKKAEAKTPTYFLS